MSITMDNSMAINNAKANANTINTDLDLSKASKDELMDVCKDFEAYFTEQVFKAMQKMVPESQEESSSMSSLTDYFKEEMVKEYSDMSAETGGLGLAQTLYEQMKRNYNVE